MGKGHLLRIAMADYRASVENFERSLLVQHYASLGENSRTTITVSFYDVTGMTLCPDLSPKQMEFRMVCGTEINLFPKEAKSPLMRCPVFVFFAPLKTIAADGQF